MEFTAKTAVITGAASGMGLLCGRNFVLQGGNAVLTDINGEMLQKAVDEVNAIRSGAAVGVACDVRNYGQVCRVRDEAVRVFGRIDLMVNFAGGSAARIWQTNDQEFPDVPIEVYDWGLDVNLKGQFYFNHAVMKQMREQRSGVIINIGSCIGEEGSADVAYSTAKSGAMYGLTKSVALYGAKYNVRCNCVSPGPVLTRSSMANMKTLLGRAADPQEIIDLILYLASDKGAFMTGINILIDGGRTILKQK